MLLEDIKSERDTLLIGQKLITELADPLRLLGRSDGHRQHRREHLPSDAVWMQLLYFAMRMLLCTMRRRRDGTSASCIQIDLLRPDEDLFTS